MHRGFSRNSLESLGPFLNFRLSNRNVSSESMLDFVVKEFEDQSSLSLSEDGAKSNHKEKTLNPKGLDKENCLIQETKPRFQISHQWPEWIDLMELLLKKGYFVGESVYFNVSEMGTKDANRIRAACLNFARDRFDLVRFFSRKDIHMVVGSGCPSIDRKVVNSGKRLRAHVGIDEGLVCSSCNLRGSCERAYVKAREDEGGRTVDVMRFLLTYGLDPFIGSVENKLCFNKSVKESIRRLLASMVELSTKVDDFDSSKADSTKSISEYDDSVQRKKGLKGIPLKQGDWVCPKCDFLNFAKNVKCLRCNGLFEERLQKLREEQEHLPLKKGDWLCDKCNFLNFAKNGKCLLCKEKPTNRQINPGEWECESCNYINFRRNMVCLKCDWKRPRASINTDSSALSTHEERGFRQPYRVNFVKGDDRISSRSSIRHERQTRNEGLSFWGDIADGENDIDVPRNGNGGYMSSKFEDFPIKGGKSIVSQNVQLWKEEVSKRRSELINLEVHAQRIDHEIRSNSSLLETTTDDEKMAGWFGGQKKIDKNVKKHKFY